MSKPERIDLLAGGSEIAKRMCAFDFSDTPLELASVFQAATEYNY